jgi:LPXTG-site transpeptidase (sortase) family protein
MSEQENRSQEMSLFKDDYMNDPFREPNFVYKTSPNTYFKIHVDHEQPKHPVKAVKKIIKQAHANHKAKKQARSEEPAPRTLRNIFKDAGRQIAASIIIFVIGFLLLNWQAYTKIVKSEVDKVFGVERTSPLEEIVETVEVVEEPEMLETSVNPEVQKKQIPELELEIAPTDNRLIVPRIDQNIPIVRVSSDNLLARDWDALEKEMQGALQDGVVHYPGTSLPGQIGNVVITGHSSYFPWDAGRFKDVFALLHDIVKGDKIVVYYEQDKYIYEVDEIQIVLPEDIEVLKQTPYDKLTLITCTPVGTNLKRLIVTAIPISKNGVAIEQEDDASSEGVTR